MTQEEKIGLLNQMEKEIANFVKSRPDQNRPFDHPCELIDALLDNYEAALLDVCNDPHTLHRMIRPIMIVKAIARTSIEKKRNQHG